MILIWFGFFCRGRVACGLFTRYKESRHRLLQSFAAELWKDAAAAGLLA
jgi:hypothetical protein